ncbi:MAG: hypothetical protein AAB263_14790, partial [Planctomycetota bacterium]
AGTSGGTVQVSFDSASPSSRNLIAGTQGVTLEVFRFLATTTEDVRIDSINFAQNVSVTASAAFQDYSLLYLVDSAGTVVGSTGGTPTSTNVYIALSNFVVRTTDTSGPTLTLKGNLSNIGSGQSVTVGGHRLGHNIAATTSVVAKGASSGSTSVVFFGGSSPASTNTHYAYRATLAVVIKTLTTKLAGGKLFEFDVKNESSIRAAVYKLSFDIATTTANVTAVTLRTYDVAVKAGKTYNIDDDGTFDLSNQVQVYSSSTASPAYRYERILFDANSDGTSQGGEEVFIPAGGMKRFILSGTITGLGSTNATNVTTQLMGDAALPTNASFANILMASSTGVDSGVHADFIWSDESIGGHATSTNDWVNGFLVTGLLSTSSTPTTISQ